MQSRYYLEKNLDVTSRPLVYNPIIGNKRMKIASFLAMTASFMAQGINVWRQHQNSRHCEEERRSNLPYFFLRLAGYTQNITGSCDLVTQRIPREVGLDE